MAGLLQTKKMWKVLLASQVRSKYAIKLLLGSYVAFALTEATNQGRSPIPLRTAEFSLHLPHVKQVGVLNPQESPLSN